MKKRELVKARTIFLGVDKGVPGREEALSEVDALLKKLAESAYRRGVKQFLKENLQGAIVCWEKSLLYQPDHAKAREAAENAKRILEKVKGIPPESKGESP